MIEDLGKLNQGDVVTTILFTFGVQSLIGGGVWDYSNYKCWFFRKRKSVLHNIRPLPHTISTMQLLRAWSSFHYNIIMYSDTHELIPVALYR